jgi:diguanylate cyclase (GGDEF)-like protein
MEQLQHYVTQDTKSLSLILFDVDNFKKINDSYGHNTGDFVLVTISNIFRLLLREEDILSRWGGEEFMICLPDTDIPEAVFFANKLRSEVGKYYFRCEDFEFHCTVTGGVVLYDREKTTEKNITEADQALYLGKSSGKNCCVSNYEVTG